MYFGVYLVVGLLGVLFFAMSLPGFDTRAK